MGKYREPIGHTCPDIDVIVGKAKSQKFKLRYEKRIKI